MVMVADARHRSLRSRSCREEEAKEAKRVGGGSWCLAQVFQVLKGHKSGKGA